MADLVPISLDRLLTRLVREFESADTIFDLPLSKGFFGSPDHDFGVRFHDRRASSALGPAAGPHSQMAQNIALAWLGGSRIIELKTVQVLDSLDIPRPCIDMRTVGYNIEWSQELTLEQSAEEYVKGAMLIEALKSKLSGRLAPGFTDTIFDMSVGYDLAGLKSPGVRRFIETMMDCDSLAAGVRSQIPPKLGRLGDIEIPPRLSDTLTLSTFHGCPPDEIEQMLEHLMREYGLNVIVKLNPTLLGPDLVDHLLHETMGYNTIRVPKSAFLNDTNWDQACGFVDRLTSLAASLGVGFGIKLTNTLIVDHDGDFLAASAKEKYLSGQPLHVLAMHLVGKFRDRFGAALPISFSAGVSSRNFADCVALGLTPVTVCSDLLRNGGYARQAAYYRRLMERMDGAGVTQVDDLVLSGAEETPERDEAIMHNTAQYVQAVTHDSAYGAAANATPPKKIGSSLTLLNCITCDKCIPVCPNDAIFTLPIEMGSVPALVCRFEDSVWKCEPRGSVDITRRHQIAAFADFCNECGNCDVFCPEDGGPYIVKPCFFGSEEEYDRHSSLDGFHVRKDKDGVSVRARFESREYALLSREDRAEYIGADFRVSFSFNDPAGTIEGECVDGAEVDLTYALIMDMMQRAALDPARVNWLNVSQ